LRWADLGDPHAAPFDRLSEHGGRLTADSGRLTAHGGKVRVH
jgi:hypothetical protein